MQDMEVLTDVPTEIWNVTLCDTGSVIQIIVPSRLNIGLEYRREADQYVNNNNNKNKNSNNDNDNDSNNDSNNNYYYNNKHDDNMIPKFQN